MPTRTRLTKDQECAIAEALNGCDAFVWTHPYYLDLIAGVNAAVPCTSGLELDVQAAIATHRPIKCPTQ